MAPLFDTAEQARKLYWDNKAEELIQRCDGNPWIAWSMILEALQGIKDEHKL